MEGPVSLVRSEKIEGYRNLGPIYEWSEGKAYLIIDRVTCNGRAGAILCYYNPPVHQVGNLELDAYLEGGRALNQEVQGRGHQDMRHGEYHLGKPYLRAN
jgi:hypothetical protein